MRGRALRIAVVLLAITSSVRAYEPDHYGWTYYLALQVGFTERQAYQLASGAYALDWDPDTEPMGTTWDKWRVAQGYPPAAVQSKWLRFHAFTETAYLELGPDTIESEKQRHQDRLWGLALREGNPGPYLHFVQDRFAHFGWENVRGHAFAGHLPDTLADDPERARQMTEATLQALQRFKAHLCGASFPGPPCSITTSPDRSRVDEVLTKLFAANPVPPGVPRSEEIRLRLPHELDATREGLSAAARLALDMLTEDSFWSALLAGGQGFLEYLDSVRTRYYPDVPMSALLRTPDLDASVAVIREAVAEDRRAGRIPALGVMEGFGGGAEAWFDNALPPKWMEYDHDGEGSVRADVPPYAVERAAFRVDQPELEYEPIEGSPNRAFKVHLRIGYSLEGLAEKLPFLHPLPTLVLHEISDFGAGERSRREHGNGSFEVVKTIQRSRADLESGRLIWKVTIHAYGFEPVVHELALAAPVETTSTDLDEATSQPGTDVGDLLDELRAVAAAATAASSRALSACNGALDAVAAAVSSRAAIAGRLDGWPAPVASSPTSGELEGLLARARQAAARGAAAVESLGPLRGEAGALRDALCGAAAPGAGSGAAASRLSGLESTAAARFAEAERALDELRGIADRIAAMVAPSAGAPGSALDAVLAALDELGHRLREAVALADRAAGDREQLPVLDARGSDLLQRILASLETAGGGTFAAVTREVDELFGRIRVAVDAVAACDPAGARAAANAELAELAILRARADELRARPGGVDPTAGVEAAAAEVGALLADLEAGVAAGELFRDSIGERAAQARACVERPRGDGVRADAEPPSAAEIAPATDRDPSRESTESSGGGSPGWTIDEGVRTTGSTRQPVPRAAPAPAVSPPAPSDPSAELIAAAEAAFARCDLVSALALAEQLAAVAPDHPWLAANLGTLHDLAAQQRSTANHLQIAQSLFASGRLKDARSALTAAARDAPGCMSGPIAGLVGEVNSAAAERREANREAFSQGLGSLLGAIGQVAGAIAANGGNSGILPPVAAAAAPSGHAHGPDGRDQPGAGGVAAPTCALMDINAYPAGWAQQFERDPTVRWYIQSNSVSGARVYSIVPAQPDGLQRMSEVAGAEYIGPYATAAAAFQAARARCSNVVQPTR